VRHYFTAGILLVLLLFITSFAKAGTQGEPFYSSGNFSVLGDSYNYADIGLGAYSFHNKDDGDGAGEANLEFRFGKKYYFVGPLIGGLANTDGAFYGYAGFYADFAYRKLVITPVAAMGGYHQGSSRNLGGVFTFRLAMNFAYQITERARVGIRLGHLSNANVHDKNPGEDEALITFAYGF